MKTAELVAPAPRGKNGQSIIKLPHGLLGFEKFKNYVLLSNPQEEPFLWLQMVDNGGKAFLVVSPFLVKPDYQPDIAEADVEFLGLTNPEDALIYNICTIKGPGQATINLKGPVVINRHTLIAKQVIPNNALQFSTCHPIPVA